MYKTVGKILGRTHLLGFSKHVYSAFMIEAPLMGFPEHLQIRGSRTKEPAAWRPDQTILSESDSASKEYNN